MIRTTTATTYAIGQRRTYRPAAADRVGCGLYHPRHRQPRCVLAAKMARWQARQAR